MSDTRFQFTTAAMLVATFFASFILAGYSRGNYLLGRGGGVMYVIIALLVTILFYRALSQSPVAKFQVVALVLFAIPVSLAFAFPTYLNSDMKYIVDKHNSDRRARAELAHLFADDPAFQNLRVSTTHRKIVTVEIHGSVPARADVDRLRTKVMKHCRLSEECLVYWHIDIGDGSTTYTGRGDDELDCSPR